MSERVDAMTGWRWFGGEALRPGLFYKRRRVIPVHFAILRPRFAWRTRSVR